MRRAVRQVVPSTTGGGNQAGVPASRWPATDWQVIASGDGSRPGVTRTAFKWLAAFRSGGAGGELGGHCAVIGQGGCHRVGGLVDLAQRGVEVVAPDANGPSIANPVHRDDLLGDHPVKRSEADT